MRLWFHRRTRTSNTPTWISRLIHPEKEPTTPALFTYHLREKLTLGGCPLCRMVRESEEQWAWTLLYEFTGDPEIHEKFARAGGLCVEHAELVRRVVEKRQLVTPSGVARLYETVTREFLKALPRMQPVEDHQQCPLCYHRDQSAARYAYFLATTLTKPEWQEAFSHSDGLCIPHFNMVIAQANQDVVKFLVDDQSRRLRDLLHRLQELQRKQRYDVHEPLTPEEIASWREALWRFGGMHFEDLLVHD